MPPEAKPPTYIGNDWAEVMGQIRKSGAPIVVLNHGHDQTVIRPGANPDSLSVWYYRGSRLLAIDAMNEPKSYAFGRKIIEAGINPPPAVVADPSTDLKALALGPRIFR
jgi:hypothetical protein